MVITFSKVLYTKKAISKAIRAYVEFADFTVIENEKDFVVNLEKIDPDFKDDIRYEFCNYVLALMKNSI